MHIFHKSYTSSNMLLSPALGSWIYFSQTFSVDVRSVIGIALRAAHGAALRIIYRRVRYESRSTLPQQRHKRALKRSGGAVLWGRRRFNGVGRRATFFTLLRQRATGWAV